MNQKNWLVSLLVALALTLTATMVSAQGPKPTPPKPNAPTANAGTAFTYQGQLKKNGSLVSGNCYLQFNLYSDSGGTGLIAGPVNGSPNPVNVANGLFTVQVDFGGGAFYGDARWLKTMVKCGSDSGFTALSLQQLMPAPMALALPGLYTQQNGSNPPNIIGGLVSNTVDSGVVGATISGGGATWCNGCFNEVSANYGTIGGGGVNRVGGDSATVGGGWENGAMGLLATVGGGGYNAAFAPGAVIGGGGVITIGSSVQTAGNVVYANDGTIGGGVNNLVWQNGTFATIGGGRENWASASNATVPGGYQASATHYGEMAYAAGDFVNPGDAQTSLYVLRNTTADANQTELFLDGSGQRITLANNRTLSFEILVTARSSIGESAGYRIWGVIKNAGGTTMVGASGEVMGNDGGFGSAIAAADSVNNALVVKVTGVSGKSIRWVAVVKTAEVGY